MIKRNALARILGISLFAGTGLAGLGIQPGTQTQEETSPEPDRITATAETVRDLDAKTGIPPGWNAPEVELQNKEGETVLLQDLYTEGPTIVAFYRGGWCPFCNKQLKDWQDYAQEFADAGVNVVFVTPETVENVNESIEKTETTYTVLSDPEHEAAELFNVIFRVDGQTQKRYKGFGIDLKQSNASGLWKLPVPGVFLIDPDGVVRWQHVDEDYRVRVDPETVLEAVQAL